ncbi:MAG TPA: hypothetical protein VIV40_24465, partial [Kofleriaceae bacterium]
MRVIRTLAVGLVTTGLVACAGEGAGDEELGEAQQAVTVANGTVVSAIQSDQQVLGGFPIVAVEPVTVTVFDLQIEAKAKWTSLLTTNLSWDADKVRQGQTLDVTRSTSALGAMKLLWTITGTIAPLGGLIPIDIGSIPIDFDLAGCTPPLDGSSFHCSADSPHVPLIDTFLPGTPFVKLAFGIDITGDGGPGTTTRTLYFGDEAGPTGDLVVNGDPQGDAHAMPCNKPAGTTIDYALDPFSWQPSNVVAVQQPKFIIGFHDPFLSIPIVLFEAPFGPSVVTHPTFDLTGAGNTVALGELLPNNVSPTVSSAGPFSGQ